jgi:uncharacterized membrane protein YedE/YeeE
MDDMLLVAGLGLAFGVPLGYAFARGGFCMNTAFRSIVFERDRSLVRAWVLALLINMVGVAALDDLHVISVTRAPFAWPALVAGGLVFGIGMVLSGGCASGSCYRAGTGMIGSLLAFLGFAAGATAITVGALKPVSDALWRTALDVNGEEATIANVIAPDSPWAHWPVIAALALPAVVWLARAPEQRFVIGWGWRRTGLAVGALALAAWVVSGLTMRPYGLSFTQPAASLVRLVLAGDPGGLNWSSFVVLGVPAGAALAALRARDLRLRLPPPARVVQQLAGGGVMGLGAGLAGGCNIGHGLTGLSTLALSSVAATAATILGVWIATALIFSAAAARAGRASRGEPTRAAARS